MLLLIDNYDSFTFNVARYFVELGQQVNVVHNDQISLEQIQQLQPEYIVISPGPCTPNEAGICMQVIQHFAGQIPILGICLGHQCIVQSFAGKVIKAKQAIHGKVSLAYNNQQGLFTQLPPQFKVARYHSLVASQAELPECLQVTAWTEQAGKLDEIMAIEHLNWPIYGVQFHPEAILSEQGHALLNNFLTQANTINR